MLSSVTGFVILIAVVFISLMTRDQTEIKFFDWHAAVVVVGGVLGSLMVALKGQTVANMIYEWSRSMLGFDGKRIELVALRAEISALQSAWQEGRRGEVLEMIEGAKAAESRVAAEVLVQHLRGERLAAKFEELREAAQSDLLPRIEGWDMVARLAPSFGIVGTVAGMIQLFRNMASNSGNLGGAMGMALLATLYGILLGTAVGGPMSTRLNQQLNERLSLIDLLERQIKGLLEEDEINKKRSVVAQL